MRVPPGVVLGLLLVACTSVRTVQPSELSASHAPSRVWVTRADSTTLVLDSARVVGDSVVGVANGIVQRVALSDAGTLKAREPSAARTAALALGLAGAYAGLMVYVMDQSNGDIQSCCANPPNPGCCLPR